MSFITWIPISHTVAKIGFITTLFFNSLIITLTFFTEKKKFGAYKYLITTSAVYGLIFASIEVLVHPVIHSHNNGYIMFASSQPFEAPREVYIAIMAAWNGCYGLTTSIMTCQFIYRYWAIFDTQKVKFFEGFNFGFSLAYTLSSGAAYSLAFYYFGMMDAFSTEYFKNELLSCYDLDITKVPCAAAVVFETNPATNKKDIRYWNLMFTCNATFILSLNYTIIIFCAIKMKLKMDFQIRKFSASLQKLHKQFFRTLIMQVITPTIMLFTPVVFIIYMAIVGTELSIPTGAMLSEVTIYPAVESCIAMIIITDYRKNILKVPRMIIHFIRYFGVKSNEVHSVTNNSNLASSAHRAQYYTN